MAQIEGFSLRQPLYVFDLPEEILATLQLRTDSSNTSHEIDHGQTSQRSFPAQHVQKEDAEPTTSSATSCALCGLAFTTLQEQRSHVRSDLHGYNLRQKMRGLKTVNEVEFEKLVEDLTESISGSDSDESESDEESKPNDSTLSALLRKQANLAASEEDEWSSRKRKRGSGKPPLLWFTSSKASKNTRLGVYRAIFSEVEQQNEPNLVDIIRQKQLAPVAPPKPAQELEGGGVAIPKAAVRTPHYFLCMIGGGHFAAMIISLAPKKGKSHTGVDERSATVLAHKTFHRYTTRRKQGGSQAANDSAKGAAHSAGSSLRRYNEAALTAEIRQLLSEWKEMINTSELLFIRATGSNNRRTLLGPYDGQVLTHSDPRNRGFPFSTRRATQAELMRSFVELTRVKISQVDEASLAASQSTTKPKTPPPKSTKPPLAAQSEADEVAVLHTTQLTALIRRSRAPALLSYLTSNSLSPNFHFHPPNHHSPTPLHLAASLASPACVTALLLKASADPGVKNGEGKTAYEIAGERGVRDAFRVARREMGEEKWDWNGAGVGTAIGREEVEARGEKERAEKEQEDRDERDRRQRELERLREEETRKEEAERERRVGKGRKVGIMQERERGMSAQEKREEEARGMTPEMRMRLERERRARAAEERMRGGGVGGVG